MGSTRNGRPKGKPWHRNQLGIMRDALEELGAQTEGSSSQREIAAQFIGACRPIVGSKLPACHDPLAFELRRGQRLLADIEVADKTVIDDALQWVVERRPRRAKRRS